MIITGDIASPTLSHSRNLSSVFEKYSYIFQGKVLICNFEGLIGELHSQQNEPTLYNHTSAIDALVKRGQVIAGLANNHILDMPIQFDTTKCTLINNKIQYTGAGKSREEAEKPAQFIEDDVEVMVFNACWEFLLYNQKNPTEGVYIAEINEEKLIKSVAEARERKANVVIVVLLHWNFDLEILPFPMHRQFAMSLIDVGANLVVGTHSHCVQGGEKYNNGYIVYGLGNFFLPQNWFAKGKITYPPMADLELALEWDIKTNRFLCHWFTYQNQGEAHTLIHIGSDDFQNSTILNQYSPFQGMDHKQYISYFSRNRRKKLLVPIFRDFRHRKRNKQKILFLKNRARFARLLARCNIINWVN